MTRATCGTRWHGGIRPSSLRNPRRRPRAGRSCRRLASTGSKYRRTTRSLDRRQACVRRRRGAARAAAGRRSAHGARRRQPSVRRRVATSSRLDERGSGRPDRQTGEHVPRRNATTKRWVASVKTDSTHPEAGLFTKDAATIARRLASRKVSPKGPASGMRMLTYFVNRAGRGLSSTRRSELEHAKRLLSERVRRARERRQKRART